MPGDEAKRSGRDRPKDGERVLDFSVGQAHLSVRYDQLVIRRDGQADLTTPLEETAVVVLASRQTTCTLAVLDGLMRHGAAVVVCDESMLPSGMMLPLLGHGWQTRRMIAQATASLPTRKQVWRQIVRAKVQAQGSLLASLRGDDAGLYDLARAVRSGDVTNVESQAAQRYWPRLFDDPDFLRRRDRPDQNRLLNYGYAVLRAAVGRAVVAAGLHPSLGVHHHDRANPYCLADDLMEPYRPLVDGEVAAIVGEWGPDAPVDARTKPRLVGVLHERLDHAGERRTVFEWISRSASSLARAICGEDQRLFFPEGLTGP
jgi:CRISPR-associated protein Cas1